MHPGGHTYPKLLKYGELTLPPEAGVEVMLIFAVESFKITTAYIHGKVSLKFVYA